MYEIVNVFLLFLLLIYQQLIVNNISKHIEIKLKIIIIMI